MARKNIILSDIVLACLVGLAGSDVLPMKRQDISTTLATSTAVQESSTPITSIPTPTPVPSPPYNTLFDCYTSSMAYNEEQNWANSHRTESIQPWTTSVSTWFTYDKDAKWYTLCDNFPRAFDPPVETKYFYSTITDFNASYTYYMQPPTTLTNPGCSYCDRCADCQALSSFIAYESSKWSEQPEPRTPSTLNWYLPCAETESTTIPTSPISYPTATGDPSCRITAEHEGTFLYWPVTTEDGDFCKYNGTTVTPTPTAPDGSPNTAVYNDLTMTSPSAYLIIDRVEARVLSYRKGGSGRSAWPMIGTITTAQTLSFDPESLSLQYPRGNRVKVGWTLDTSSLNYQDFNTPPFNVYSKAACSRTWGSCDRQYHDYRPYLGSPQEITKLSSDWGYCSVWGWMRPIPVPITAGVTTTVDVKAAKTTETPIGTDE